MADEKIWEMTRMKTKISARGRVFPEESLLHSITTARRKQEKLVLCSLLYCAEAREKAIGYRKTEKTSLAVRTSGTG